MASAHIGPVAAFFQRLFSPIRRFFRWLWRFPETAYIWLISLISKSAGEEVRKERADKRKRKAEKEPDTVVYRKHPWFLIRAAAIPIITLIITGRGDTDPWTVHAKSRSAAAHRGRVGNLGDRLSFLALVSRRKLAQRQVYPDPCAHHRHLPRLPLGLREEVKQAEWDKVQNASFLIPYFWANLLDFGTVTVETASTFGNFDFVHVPHPAAVQQEVFLRMEIARQASEKKAKAALQSVQLEALDLYHHYQTDQ